MHRAWEADPATHCDNVADDMWNPGQFRVDEWGGEYGPYQIQPYASGVKGHYTKIYYTLSTANPYSVMQMTTVILTEGEALDPNAYAYDATAPNDRKYARISILQAQLAAARNMSWDFLGQGSQSCADHIEWAQFQSHFELRAELKGKFLQMMTKLADPGARADAYANITDTVVTLGADGPYDFVNYNAHYGWALNAIQNGHPEWLVSEMNMRIDREHFLPSMPTV